MQAQTVEITVPTTTPIVEVPTPIVPELTRKEKIISYIEKYGTQYSVSKKLLNYMAAHESRYGLDSIGDTNLICARTGKQEHSRGVVQINDCYHPEISDKLAFDDEFSIEYAAKQIAAGNCSQWTTCRNYYAQ